MYDIEEDQFLAKKAVYLLQGDQQTFTIEVYQVIQGKSEHKFIARPVENAFNFNSCDDKFYGRSDSEEEALSLCLKLIKGKTKEELFPRKEKETKS